MKQSAKITIGGMTAALSIALMFMTSFIPFLTYALPAIAGLLLTMIVIEINKKWAWAVFAAVSLLSIFVIADKESAMMYIAFFGYYPIIKSNVEKIKLRWIEWIVKLLIFNAAITVAYFIIIYLFQIPIEEMKSLGRYSLYILYALANGMFILYDIALTQLITAYVRVWRKKFLKVFKM